MKVRQVLRYLVPLLILFVVVLTAAHPATAQGGAVKPPIPYPDAPKIDVGGTPVQRLPIDQIVTYKALPKYQQAPWLDKFVSSGQLPPVEKRLPKEPAVYLKSGMKDGIGQYGDVWRAFSACPTAGYNEMAGVSAAWYRIESYTFRYGSLVKTRPLFRAAHGIYPFPPNPHRWDLA